MPQPGHPSGGTSSAGEFGYTGTILGSSGHVRCTVGPNEAKGGYMRIVVAGVTWDDVPNRSVAISYTLKRK